MKNDNERMVVEPKIRRGGILNWGCTVIVVLGLFVMYLFYTGAIRLGQSIVAREGAINTTVNATVLNNNEFFTRKTITVEEGGKYYVAMFGGVIEVSEETNEVLATVTTFFKSFNQGEGETQSQGLLSELREKIFGPDENPAADDQEVLKTIFESIADLVNGLQEENNENR